MRGAGARQRPEWEVAQSCLEWHIDIVITVYRALTGNVRQAGTRGYASLRAESSKAGLGISGHCILNHKLRVVALNLF